MVKRQRDISQIGYSHVRVLNRIYEVRGYAIRPASKSSKQNFKVDKTIIELQEVKRLKDGQWFDVESESIERPINQPWNIYKGHEFYQGTLSEYLNYKQCITA